MRHLNCNVFLTNLKKIQVRYVSSLSPLGTAFNSRPLKSTFLPNHFGDGWKFQKNNQQTGLFQIPGLTSPRGFEELEVECSRRCQLLVEEAVSNISNDKGYFFLFKLSMS